MHVIYQCPACGKQQVSSLDAPATSVCCECGWSRNFPEAPEQEISGHLRICRVCGCEDLWRQKDFPPALGLVFVAMGIIFSSTAWAFHLPVLALGILMGFALIDLILYTFMGDMLVCYRCRSRHRRTSMDEEHPRFSLEVAERYHQQELKKQQKSR